MCKYLRMIRDPCHVFTKLSGNSTFFLAFAHLIFFFSSCINLQRPWEFLIDANMEKPLVTTKPRENRLLLYLSATNLSGKREWKIHNLTMYYAFSTILAARVQFLTNHVAQFSDNLGGTNFTKR
jgi:hypothetical protein